MKTKNLLFTPTTKKILFLLVAVCLLTATCKKETDPNNNNNNIITGLIKQPATFDAPAVLPQTTMEIKKFEGDFTPLLTGFVADWKIVSKYKFTSNWYPDCWGDEETDLYPARRRDNIKGIKLEYKTCFPVGSNSKPTPNFSGTVSSAPWGQYEKGADWKQDGEGWLTTGHIKYKRSYKTILDLPDAYILKETKWEIVPISGFDYYISEGYQTAHNTTSTKVGLTVKETQEWGYTLGMEYNIGATVEFAEFGLTVSASFNQQFSTSIENKEEYIREITLDGTLLEGTNIIRLQAFREVSIFKLVNKDGDPYYDGIYDAEIAITTNTHEVAWYY